MIKKIRVYRIIQGSDDDLPMMKWQDDDDGLPTLAPSKKKESSGSVIAGIVSGVKSGQQKGFGGAIKAATSVVPGEKYEAKSNDQLAQELGYVKNKDGVWVSPPIAEEKPVIELVDDNAKDDPVKHALREVNKDAKYIDMTHDFNDTDQTGHQPSYLTLSEPKKITTNKDLKEQGERFDKVNIANDYIQQTVFPTGIEANKYLEKVKSQKGQLPADNQTVNMALKVSNDYSLVGDQLENSADIEHAALKDFIANHPEFKEQYDAVAQSNYGHAPIPEALQGRMIAEYLYKHGKNIEAYAKEHPEFADDYNDVKNNLLTKYPDFGINVVANDISKKRQELGYNSRIANINTSTFSKHNDEIAEQLYKDDPQRKAIYDAHKDEIHDKIDVPGFINRAVTGIEEGAAGQLETFHSLSGDAASSIYRNWEQGAKSVSAGETGSYKTIGEMGHMTGFVAEMAATGNVLRGVGIPSGVANRFLIADTFLGKSIDEGYSKFPNNKFKAITSGVANTVAFMLLPDIVPVGKVNNVLAGVKKEISKSLSELGDEAISKAAYKDAITSGFKRGVELTGAFAKQHTKSVLELATLNQFTRFVDKGLGMNKDAFEHYHPVNEIPETIKLLATANLIPSAIAGYGDFSQREHTKNTIWEVTNDPDKWLRISETNPNIPDNLKKDIQDKIKSLVATKDVLDENKVPEKGQKSYLLHSMNEQQLKAKAETTTEPTLKKKYLDDAKRSHEIKEGILKGIPEEKIIENQAIKEVKQMYNDGYLSGAAGKELETIKTEGGEGKFDEEKVIPFLKQVAEGTKKAPDNIQKIADEMFPDAKQEVEKPEDLKSTSVIMPDENKVAENVPLVEKKGAAVILPEENKVSENIPLKNENTIGEQSNVGEVDKATLENIVGGAMGNQGLAIIYADIKEHGESVINNIDKATPEQVQKIKSDFEELKKLYPEKNLTLTEERNSIKIKSTEQTINETTKDTNKGDEPQQAASDSRPAETIPEDVSTTKEGEGGGKEPPISEPSKVFVQRPATELSHRGLQDVANEFSLPDIQTRDRKSDIQLRQDATNTANEWAEKGVYAKKVEGLVEKAEEGGGILTDEQRVILEQHLANVSNELRGMDIKSPEYDTKLAEIKRLKDAGEKTRSEAGAALRIPLGGSRPKDIADFMVDEMDAAGVDNLTEKQKETVQKEYEDISDAKTKFDDYVAKKEAELSEREAALKLQKITKEAKGDKKKDYAGERQKIVGDILLKLSKARGESASFLGAAELASIAPDVLRLVKNVAEQGISKLSEVVDKVYDSLKDKVPDIEKKHIHDIIAGLYTERKATRNELAAKRVDLKIEAQLVNKLEALESGQEPKSEKKKIQRNKQIADLKKKIKPYTDLKAQKTKMANEIKEIEKQIRTGDFEKEQKKPPIELDKEGQELKDKLIKLRQNRELRMLLQKRQNETGGQKALRTVAEVANIPRTLMTIADFSALLRQNIFFSAGHPLMTLRNIPDMFRSFTSQKVYDHWFSDLKEMKRYDGMKESKLAIADSLSHDLTQREEAFMSTLAEKIPLIGQSLKVRGKTVIPGLNIVKGSERSYTMLLNKMRVDMYNFFAESMERRGLTVKNSPKQYRAMAEYINNATGRSDFGKTLNRIAPVLNSVFFSPRLIASRVNMLTYWAQPRFWKTLPREVKVDYMRNWISLLAIGGTILGMAKLGGADVEDDPRSSDFGKIKSGDTRWDIWGGAQPYVRVMAQMISGKRKSTNSGKLYSLNGDDIFGEDRAGVVADFFRNKLAPVPGAAVDLLSGRTGVGEKVVYKWNTDKEKEVSIRRYIQDRIIPMTFTGTAEAMKDQGVKSIFTVGVPSIFGVGTQNYQKPVPKSASTKETKETKFKTHETRHK